MRLLSWNTPLHCACVTALLSTALAAQAPPSHSSGIVNYAFEPNPQDIKPKMYNWEIRLNEADSKAGAYEIVQMTRPVAAGVATGEPVVAGLVDSKMIVPGEDGAVDFHLYVGDKTPHQNMARQGDSGQPIIFSGLGTGKGESSWIMFPGATIDRATPSLANTPLTDGRLTVIRFLVHNDRGAQFQTDVILRRK